jgi:hypothetical protein
LTTESQRIAIVCDADFSNREMYQKLREKTTIEDMVVIYQYSEKRSDI